MNKEENVNPTTDKEEPKRTSGMSRIVGATPEEEKFILNRFKRKFEHQFRMIPLERLSLAKWGIDEKDAELWEIAKDDKEEEMVRGIIEKMEEFVKKNKYECNPVNLTPQHIHFLHLESKSGKKIEQPSGWGFQSSTDQFIGVFPIYDNLLANAHLVAHEILHFHGFDSITLELKKQKAASRRSGFAATKKTGESSYFYYLNEAITEKLLKKFEEEYFSSILVISKEKEERKEFYENQKIIGEYDEKIEEFDRLVEKIYNNPKNKGKFSSSNEVYEIFYKAVFSGRLLDVARLIEGVGEGGSLRKNREIYGKGFFRKQGQKTKK